MLDNNGLMAQVFIGIGSNRGDRQVHLAHARRALADLPRTALARFSPVYETAPAGPIQQQPAYLNAAALLETQLDPFDLLDQLNQIELAADREPPSQRVRWGPRTLDLDILLYAQRVISNDELVVPHPMMHERWFVLKPLADLDPQAVHPLLQMTVGELLQYLEQAQATQTP